jgi:hypothetical protein
MSIEIAEYIERGLGTVAGRAHGGFRIVETPCAFLDLSGHTYCAGALGLALIGKAGDPQAAFHAWQQVSNTSPAGRFDAAAALLGISVGLARLVEINHRNGVPAMEIASSLRIGTLSLAFRTRPAYHEAARAVDTEHKTALRGGLKVLRATRAAQDSGDNLEHPFV